MPYRITMSVDIPDASDKATTDTARNAFDALSAMEEAAGQYDADFNDEDVEWYAADLDGDELTINSWTYTDEELLRDALGFHPDIDCEERLRNEAESDDHADRLIVEFRKRTAEIDLGEMLRYLGRMQQSLPEPDQKLGAIERYLRRQLGWRS